MKSNLIAASILAVAALASVSSFAEGNFVGRDAVYSTNARTRAEVQAELAQAQRDGYNNVNSDQNDWYSPTTPVATKAQRSVVKAEALASRNDSASALYSGQ